MTILIRNNIDTWKIHGLPDNLWVESNLYHMVVWSINRIGWLQCIICMTESSWPKCMICPASLSSACLKQPSNIHSITERSRDLRYVRYLRWQALWSIPSTQKMLSLSSPFMLRWNVCPFPTHSRLSYKSNEVDLIEKQCFTRMIVEIFLMLCYSYTSDINNQDNIILYPPTLVCTHCHSCIHSLESMPCAWRRFH